MLALGFGKSKDRPTRRTFVIDVGLAVTELIAAELKEAAEAFVFSASFLNVTGEHTKDDEDDQRQIDDGGKKPQNGCQPRVGDKERNNVIDKHENDVGPEKHLGEGVRAVSAVHKAIKRVFDLTHDTIDLCPERSRGRAFLFLILFGAKCFHGILLGCYLSRDQTCNEGKEHADRNQHDRGYPRKNGIYAVIS